MDKLTCVYDKGFFNRLGPLAAISESPLRGRKLYPIAGRDVLFPVRMSGAGQARCAQLSLFKACAQAWPWQDTAP